MALPHCRITLNTPRACPNAWHHHRVGRPKQPRVDKFTTGPDETAANRRIQDAAARHARAPRKLALLSGQRATITVRPRRHARSVTAYILMCWRDPVTGKEHTLNLCAEVPGDRTAQIEHGWQLIAEHRLFDQFNHDAYKDYRSSQRTQRRN